MRSDIGNMISSAHSEFEYTIRCNAPDRGILLNMESACAYFALYGEDGLSERPEPFLCKYIQSPEARISYNGDYFIKCRTLRQFGA